MITVDRKHEEVKIGKASSQKPVLQVTILRKKVPEWYVLLMNGIKKGMRKASLCIVVTFVSSQEK